MIDDKDLKHVKVVTPKQALQLVVERSLAKGSRFKNASEGCAFLGRK